MYIGHPTALHLAECSN